MSGPFRLCVCLVRALSSLDQGCVTVEQALFQGPRTSGDMSCPGIMAESELVLWVAATEVFLCVGSLIG